MLDFEGWCEKEVIGVFKETLRHEILHAFLNESGLCSSTLCFEGGWTKNEEMIDWFAIQFPKIAKVYKECGCN